MKRRKNDKKREYEDHNELMRISEVVKSERKGSEMTARRGNRDNRSQRDGEKGEYAQIKQFPLL